MNASPPVEPRGAEHHDLGRRARGVAAIVWSGFLAAAIATMLCFAFLDPLALQRGEPPEWWTSRLHVYAVGFFFFWLIGVIAAALSWQLTRSPGSGGRDE